MYKFKYEDTNYVNGKEFNLMIHEKYIRLSYFLGGEKEDRVKLSELSYAPSLAHRNPKIIRANLCQSRLSRFIY